MNTRTQVNDKPLFEIDAHIVLRLNAGDGVPQQFELTRDDLSMFCINVLDRLLGKPYINLTGMIYLENGTSLLAQRIGDEILISKDGAPYPARLSLDQARSLVRMLESAADCFDAVPDPEEDEDEDGFLDGGGTPASDGAFISEEEDENPTNVVRLTTKGNHQQLSKTIKATVRNFRT